MTNPARRTNGTAKPFVKWAGGKSQILPEIRALYPAGLGVNIHKYAEPFAGGGAVLFDVLNRFSFDAIYINDINRELIHTYKTIRDDVEALIAMLRVFVNEYIPESADARKKIYYAKRERFNALIKSKCHITELAALFIFLNRTCFNGLYRVNAGGEFNVPQGRYQTPRICDEANLRAVSEKLRRAQIVCGDYTEARNFIDSRTFVYFDPPYRPLSATSNFISYSPNGFNDAAQAALARFIDEMSKRGAYILASNSDPTNTDAHDDFFETLYARHKILRIEAGRAINAAARKRGRIRELLITNK